MPYILTQTVLGGSLRSRGREGERARGREGVRVRKRLLGSRVLLRKTDDGKRTTETHTNQKKSPSRVIFFVFFVFFFWSRRRDLNSRPLPPQGSTLPGCATPRHLCFVVHALRFKFLHSNGVTHRRRRCYLKVLQKARGGKMQKCKILSVTECY
jgi:hypothetical protein